jgi:hypothetical protein
VTQGQAGFLIHRADADGVLFHAIVALLKETLVPLARCTFTPLRKVYTSVSKYQQCIEKSVKGVLDKLQNAGITNAHSDSRHHIARYAAVFTNIPRTSQTGDLLNQLKALHRQGD